ncbi:Transketolase, central region domain protein, partial [mine drainage metagenome]
EEGMTESTLIQAVNQALREAMRADPDVILLGEDIGVNGGVFRATEGLLKEFGEDRVMDTPLNESGIVGTAVGMALYGLKPV